MLEIALIYALIGVIVKLGKLHFILAGYYGLPETEKAKINTDKLENFFLFIMLSMSLSLIVCYYLQSLLSFEFFDTICIIAISIIGAITLMKNKQQFQKND